ncbi:MAG: prepilin-type N-terminal cleavage/methylation domain-containing protein [Idiomarina sp.]|nr:prepilin-type N-terminal cleavage/methylation domain-containing protein [Idiomarina sp.]
MLARQRAHGFTLLELLLVSGLSGIILTTWIGSLSQQLVALDKRLQTARKTQQFNQLGFWLSHELERARDNGDYAWLWAENCLIYGESSGVRVQNGLLQWRGGPRLCTDSGWVSLGDPEDYQITHLSVTHAPSSDGNGYLQLSGIIEGEPVTWEYRFNGKLYFTP